jgi:endonuclease/exonuclease/phosphatase family metal-dependent hydrolase
MRIILLILFAAVTIIGSAQNVVPANLSVTVAFYNVENLFDTVDDPSPGDDEFLPGSSRVWDKKRYEKKLKDIAGTLGSINSLELPGIIGLAEVENRLVLDELVKESPLRRGKYEIVHFDSPDERGIDVALLYRPDEFTLVESRTLSVAFPFSPLDKTRDILYVRGVLDDGKSYHIYVNHWPSRSGDARESEMRRYSAAATLRKDIDNILNFEPDARIIIMGDFNDDPTNSSLMQVLNATNKRKNHTYRDLYNLMYDNHNEDGIGTLTYRGEWNMFDQIIVSFSLLANNGSYYTGYDGGKIHMPAGLLFANPETGFKSPNRTYGGETYYGGVSDHLPVWLELRKDDSAK